MKRMPPVKPKPAVYTKKSDSIVYRRGFPIGGPIGLILLAACIVLNGSFLYGQDNDDALFIDKNGNVTFKENLKVKEDVSVTGSVRAKKFEGDGSGMTVGGVEFVTKGKDNLPLTLEEVVRALIADMVPIGTIMAYGGDVTNQEIKKKLAAQGWLACDGSPINVDEYHDLYNTIGNAFGQSKKEEKQGQFRVPDMRGRFLRGVNYDAKENKVWRDPDAKKRKCATEGGNTGNQVGSVQNDDYKQHSHPLERIVYKHYRSFKGENDKQHTLIHNYGQQWITKTQAVGGEETRPKNIYVNWIIKAKHIIR